MFTRNTQANDKHLSIITLFGDKDVGVQEQLLSYPEVTSYFARNMKKSRKYRNIYLRPGYLQLLNNMAKENCDDFVPATCKFADCYEKTPLN